MTCELWRDQIDTYVDGELGSGHESEVARHLRSCAECTAFAADAIHLKRGVAGAGKRYQPSAEFRRQLMDSIGAREKSRIVGLLPRFAIAAVLLISVGVASLMLMRREPPVDREIVDVHLNTIASANPVDVVSTDQHTVKPWFQGKVPFTFNVPDLTNSQFTLVGGRVAYVRNTPTALLLFRYKLHNVTVFIGPEAALGSGEGTERLPNGFNVIRRQKDGRTLVTVSDADANTIADLAERVRAAQ